MKIRLAADLQQDSIVDGLGIRTVIWTQGCSHNCFNCHNPSTHDFKGGVLVDIDDIKQEIDNLCGQDGVTFSGGDPMFQANACNVIAKYVHSLGMNVWTYTGFTYEEILSKGNKDMLEFLSNTDVLIDGKYDESKKSMDIKFRGSRNQRIIDVKKSLENHTVVLLDLDNEENFSYDKREIYV